MPSTYLCAQLARDRDLFAIAKFLLASVMEVRCAIEIAFPSVCNARVFWVNRRLLQKLHVRPKIAPFYFCDDDDDDDDNFVKLYCILVIFDTHTHTTYTETNLQPNYNRIAHLS